MTTSFTGKKINGLFLGAVIRGSFCFIKEKEWIF